MISKRKILVSALLTAGLMGIILPQAQLPKVMAAQSGLFVVQKGDSLSEIAAKYGVSVKELQAVNKLSGTLIRIGQTLRIPDSLVHDVEAGDNLSTIAKRYKTTVEAIKRANGLTGDTIYPNGKLIIPRGKAYQITTVEKNSESRQEIRNEPLIQKPESDLTEGQDIRVERSDVDKGQENVDQGVAASSDGKRRIKLSEEDIYLLAKLIHAEARGESMRGKIAVGAVILNRLESQDFPKTVREIIYQKNQHVYQFSPVEDGSINLEPNESAWRAAEAAVAGEDPTNGSLFFYNPDLATDEWIKTLPVSTVIGNHVFAR